MSSLFKQGKNISEFKPDDIITRIEPAKRNGDMSYRGTPCKYVGIANNMIFFDILNDHIFADNINRNRTSVPMETFEDGWALYESI